MSEIKVGAPCLVEKLGYPNLQPGQPDNQTQASPYADARIILRDAGAQRDHQNRGKKTGFCAFLIAALPASNALHQGHSSWW